MEEIRPLASEDEARRCAEMMCSTEPWITIGRSFEENLALIQGPNREVFVVDGAHGILGFVVINMSGSLIGYIQTICVDAEARRRGVGTLLIEFAERRIFADTTNVFLCVSSFNTRARALYERLGYKLVGEMDNYVIEGASEFLMRKTIGPILKRATSAPRGA